MKTLLTATVLILFAVPGASAIAATITNRDAEAHTLTVSEGGSQSEVSIGAGETIEICPSGCFVTMPNGDREALTGSETIDIEAGRGRVL